MTDGQNLTPQQLDAIEWILPGCTDQEVGDLVQADRTTVWRWKHRNVRFREELERRREARRESIQVRAEHLDVAALGLVARRIEEGDVRVALQYLRLRLGQLFGSELSATAEERAGDALRRVDALSDAIRQVLPPETWTE